MLETRGRVGGKIFICDKKNRRFFFSQIKILINFFLEHSVLGKKIYEKIFFSSTPCSGKIFFRKSFYKFFLFAKQIKKIYKNFYVCVARQRKKKYISESVPGTCSGMRCWGADGLGGRDRPLRPPRRPTAGRRRVRDAAGAGGRVCAQLGSPAAALAARWRRTLARTLVAYK